MLYIAVKGPGRGLASLYLGSRDDVSILHASAALGTAHYHRSGETWSLRNGFDWKVRDTPGTGGAPASERQEFLASDGWLANSSQPGSPVREFAIKLTPEQQYLGITFLAIDTMEVTYWPPSMADDCRAVDLLRGDPPQVVRLQPETWHRITK